MAPNRDAVRDRVLVFAPLGRDGALTSAVLEQHQIVNHVCAGFRDLAESLDHGASAVLITEEALAHDFPDPLVRWMARQPPWSDLPVMILVDRGRDTDVLPQIRSLQDAGNVTLLERPVSIAALVSAVRAAQRARRRQYEVHDALEALAESERRYRTLAEALPQLVWTADHDGKVDYVNRQWIEFTGKQEQAGEREWIAGVIHPDDRSHARDTWLKARGNRTNYDAELRLRRGDGEYFWFKTRATPIVDDQGEVARWFGTCTDITDIVDAREALSRSQAELEKLVEARTHSLAEANNRLTAEMARRTQAQEALHQAQKMESVGQLTGGVAHDFNNLLTAVIGSFVMAERRIIDPEVRQLMTVGRRAAQRGATLTQQLLAFSRKQRLQPQTVDLNKLVDEATEMLRRTIGSTIRIEKSLAPNLWPARVDPTQIELVLLNLAINSRDAMPNGGTITVRTWNLQVSELPPNLPPGEYVALSVADTGTGMPPEIAARAIEPFFTTKSVGKGSGLGLSMAHGVVEQSGGRLDIKTKPGEGTRITLVLPRSPATVSTSAIDETQSLAVPRHATILVVDDDHDVREIAVTGLKDLGYRVLAANSGQEALNILKGTRVDFLVVDIAMPEMNGVELVRRVRECQADIPALLVTGYANVDMFAPSQGDMILQKPYSFDRLAECVALALRRAGGTAAKPSTPREASA